MARKYSYSYTPHRKGSGRRVRAGYGGARLRVPSLRLNTPVMLVAPVVLVLAVVLVSRVAGGEGSGAASENNGCGGGCPAVLSGAQTPAPSAPSHSEPAPTAQPVVVHEDDRAVPSIEGRSFAVFEASCGALLQHLNGDSPLPPASLTKIVTALVVVDHADLDEVVTVDVDGAALSLETDSTVMGVEPGDTLTVRDLLYGLLLRSGNDAAVELAEHVAGGEESFVSLMNDKAAQLGLVNTHFANAHGLDEPGLYSSAIDMVILGAALLSNRDLSEIVRTREYQPAWDRGPIDNLNILLNSYPGAIGVKTGFTDGADQTIVAAAERGGRTIVVSILGTTYMYEEAVALLDWAFSTEPACVGAAG